MADGAGGCQSRRLSGDEGASTLDKWIVYGLPPLEETLGSGTSSQSAEVSFSLDEFQGSLMGDMVSCRPDTLFENKSNVEAVT